MKHTRRVLSVLLTLTMILSLMPAMGSAARAATEVNSWASLQEALNGASGSESAPTAIKLTDDLKAGQSDASLTVPGGKYVTLDLAGHTIDRGLYDSRKTEAENAAAATSGGYVLRVDGSLTLTDSSATVQNPVGAGRLTGGNNSSSTMYCGGGVCVAGSGGRFTMAGGTISGNSADEEGGGVYVAHSSQFTMIGGMISGNASGYQGGGVCVAGDSTFAMEGGSIERCTTKYSGSGVYVDQGGTFRMSGGTVSENSHTDLYGLGGVYVADGGSFKAGGSATVTGNKFAETGDADNVYLEQRGSDKPYIHVTGALTGTIGVNAGFTGVIAQGDGYDMTAADAARLVLDKTDKQLAFEDGKLSISEPETDWARLQKMIDDAADGAAITLDRDYTAASYNKELSIEKGLTLDLAGHTLRGATGNSVIYVSCSGKTLTVRDSSTEKTGRITGGYCAEGGGVYLSEGSFRLEGGTITGNRAADDGGGVHVASDSAFTLAGGSITGNRAGLGGGVYINCGTVSLESGSITGNVADENGGGVYVEDLNNNNHLFASGAPTVLDNTVNGEANNVCLKKGTIRIPAPLAGPIGVCVESESSPAGKAVARPYYYEITDSDVLWLRSDNGDYTARLKNDGWVYLEEVTKASDWTSLQEALNGASGSESAPTVIKLTDDLKAGEGDQALTVPSGKYVILDLGGKTVDRGLYDSQKTEAENTAAATDGGHVLKVEGSLTLRDSSVEKTGSLTGGNCLLYGGGVNVNGGTFTMVGGTIGENRAAQGGGVYVTGNGTFTMVGGRIAENSASFDGGGVQLNRGSFTMSGGTIGGNRANGTGGGVNTSFGNTIRISGSPVISGNYKIGEEGAADAPSNLWLVNGDFMGRQYKNIIEIEGRLDKKARIGVGTTYAPDAFTSGLSGSGTAENFFSDDARYDTALNTDGEAHFVGACSVTGTLSGKKLTCAVTNAPSEGARLFAAWYDASGRLLGVSAASVTAGDTANIQLAVGAGAAVCKLMLVDLTNYAPLCRERRILP